MMAQSTTHELGPGAAAAGLQAAVSSAVVAACVHAFGDRLRGIVLTGSLARREATFVRDSAGWNALGDAEFFVVFEQRRALPGAAQTESVRQEAEHTLMGEGIRCHIDLSPVHPAYLRGLPPHIASYELRACGRVIWGDEGILTLIPAFPATEISREDAWRLLANRIIELLEAVVVSGDPQSDQAKYRTVKLFLDMATSYLVFAGGYLPTYRERAQALQALAERAAAQAEAPFPLVEFAATVSACTSFKIESAMYPGTVEVLWEDAVRFAELLWKWELSRLTGAAADLPNNELMVRWMASQPRRARLRGWASLLRRSGWLRSWRQWPRWARLHGASPRYWVYSVAAEVFFRLPCALRPGSSNSNREADWRALARTLPAITGGSTETSLQPWRWLAVETARNYHRFLETTRS